jgi:hypothetical protein
MLTSNQELTTVETIIITSGIIKAKATCGSFLVSAKNQSVQARCSAMNGLGGSSNTTSVKPHEFFDHMTRGVLAQVPLCAAACFPAFDDLLTLTMWTPDGTGVEGQRLATFR